MELACRHAVGWVTDQLDYDTLEAQQAVAGYLATSLRDAWILTYEPVR